MAVRRLFRAQGRDAGGAVDLLAVAGAAGLDIGCACRTTGFRRIEEYVEDTGASGKLQLARIPFPDVEPGRTELADQIVRSCTDDSLKTWSRKNARLGRRDRYGADGWPDRNGLLRFCRRRGGLYCSARNAGREEQGEDKRKEEIARHHDGIPLR